MVYPLLTTTRNSSRASWYVRFLLVISFWDVVLPLAFWTLDVRWMTYDCPCNVHIAFHSGTLDRCLVSRVFRYSFRIVSDSCSLGRCDRSTDMHCTWLPSSHTAPPSLWQSILWHILATGRFGILRLPFALALICRVPPFVASWILPSFPCLSRCLLNSRDYFLHSRKAFRNECFEPLQWKVLARHQPVFLFPFTEKLEHFWSSWCLDHWFCKSILL